MPRRATFFRLHSWLGVITGAFLLLVCWSGSIVVFNDEIAWLVTPEVRADPARGVRPIDEVVAAVRAHYPEQQIAINLQVGPNWAHTAYVQDLSPRRFLFIDPATAEVRRDDAMQGYTWNVSYFLRQLHVRLLMGLWGRVFVGLLGVTLLLSIVTSLWIYREWLRSLFRLRRDAARRIFHMDLHKAVGLWALAFNVVFAVTGAVLGLENLYYQVWSRAAQEPPRAAAAGGFIASAGRSISPGQMVAALASLDPAFISRVLEIPRPGDSGPIVIRGDHRNALIAKNASSYSVDPTSGTTVGSMDARRARWGTTLYNAMDPLHFGYFGEGWGLVAGYLVKVIWFLAGLTPGVLSLTGGMMWLLRRRRARAAAAAARYRAADGRVPPHDTGDEARAAQFAARHGFALGLLAFFIVGYCLQATIWQRGWVLNEVMWQHWMVKPICLTMVCFPVTAAAIWLGRISVNPTGATPRARTLGLLGAVPSGLLYLAATAVLN
ncbi:MAG: hypothetical protein GEU99_07505 [Luteitalea sp.]|nr:hypothetical protein [Luteitalea sp.]